MDYRVLSFLSLVGWGTWGFLSKLLAGRGCSAGLVAFWAGIGGLVPVAAFVVVTRNLHWRSEIPLALLAGLLAGFASVCFYVALSRGPASVVVPLSGMYIVISAVLGYLFLQEPLTWKHLIGLGCGALAVVLLSL